MIATAITQSHQVWLAGMDMTDQSGIVGNDCFGRFTVNRHCSGVELHTDCWMIDPAHHCRRLGAVGHEIGTVAGRIGFETNPYPVGAGAITQALEELHGNSFGLGVAEIGAIPIFWGAEHQPGRAQTAADPAHGVQMRQHGALYFSVGEQVQASGSKQQRLHPGDFDAAMLPPLAHPEHIRRGRLPGIGEILAGSNVNGVYVVLMQQIGHRFVIAHVPGDIGDGDSHWPIPASFVDKVKELQS